jgi:hypothetical protein
VPNPAASEFSDLAAAELYSKADKPADSTKDLQTFFAAWPAPEGEPPLWKRARALEKSSSSLRKEN